MTSDADLQLFDVGETHTIAASNCNKLYSAGWNDCFQLGRNANSNHFTHHFEQIHFNVDLFRPKAIVCGDNHNMLVDAHGILYVWGDNSKGQLGLGHSRHVPKIQILDFL